MYFLLYHNTTGSQLSTFMEYILPAWPILSYQLDDFEPGVGRGHTAWALLTGRSISSIPLSLSNPIKSRFEDRDENLASFH